MQMPIYLSSKPVATYNNILLEHHSDIAPITPIREIPKTSHFKLTDFQKIKFR